MTRKFTALALAPLLLAACSSAPHKDVAHQDKPQPEDVAGIGPRPAFFGRHAWDEQQAAARAKAAKPTAPATPAAPPAAVVAQAAPPPPPLPPVAAPPPPAPTPQLAVAPPLPAPAPVQPIAPPPPPAPVMQTAAAEPAPPIKPEKPAKAPKPPKPPKDAPEAKKPFHLPFGLTPVQAPPPPPPLAGGYADATDKSAVQAAAAFAVHESPGYELKGIYSAKTQVVAGTNYSLCLWVRQVKHEANPLTRRLVSATVFQGLDRHYELTNWHEVPECHAGT
jgi:hypothetical protein